VRASQLLEYYRPRAGMEDLRGWEWRYLWRRCHGEIRSLRGHTGTVTSLAFAPDGRTLASGSADGTVRLWDMAAGRERAVLASPGAVTAIGIGPDGRTLALASGGATLRRWDLPTGQPRRSLPGRWFGAIHSLAYSPDGRWLVAGSDGRPVLW